MTATIVLALALSAPTAEPARRLPEAAVCQRPAKAAPVPSSTVPARPAFRAPRGHTHTCANGHTWDHDANPGHTCQTCGLPQYVQDSVPRSVPVYGVTYSAPPAPQTYQYTLPGAYGSAYGATYGGCAGGSCNIQSGGLFKRR